MPKKKIPMAICYDFDGTLSPRNMQEYEFIELLKNCDSKQFWKESTELAERNNMDRILAYMYLMLKKARDNEISFHYDKMVEYGKNIVFFNGVEDFFSRINSYARERNIELKHYIISSGLEEMIQGCRIRQYFDRIFASRFYYDYNKIAVWPAIALNYTTKTQFLFRINKGCLDISDDKSINEYKAPENRAIPFTNMVYIGDGETDIPCMRIVKRDGGHSIAVYNPQKKGAKKNLEKLLNEDRVNMIAPADYRENKIIDKYIKAIIDKILLDNYIKRF